MLFAKSRLIGLIVISYLAVGLVLILSPTAASEEAGPPPHTERQLAAPSNQDGSLPPEAEAAVAMGNLDAWFSAVAAAEQARLAAAAAAPPAPARTAPQAFDYPAECAGHPIPAYIVWRESHCNYGSVNPTGCGGYGCVGMYQFDLRHWMEGGGCAWLGDWTVPANQDACAAQMSKDGTDLSPWGG